MPKLSDASLMHFAQELTKIALENGFIPHIIGNDEIVSTSKGKAQCVSEFYKTLLDTLNPEE